MLNTTVSQLQCLDCQFAAIALSNWKTTKNFQCLWHVWRGVGKEVSINIPKVLLQNFSSEWPDWLHLTEDKCENLKNSRNKFVKYYIYVNSKELLEEVVTFRQVFPSVLSIAQTKLWIFYNQYSNIAYLPNACGVLCMCLFCFPPPQLPLQGRILFSVFRM